MEARWPVEDLFTGYSSGSAWDEIVDPTGHPREVARRLYETLRALTASDLDERCAERDRSFRDRGITFSLSGEERPFPLDPVPRPIATAEWAVVEAGVRQRVRALEALLQDVYGAGEVFEAGILPRRVATTSENFQRAAWAIEPPNGVRIQVAGIDLVRDASGRFCVLEDNVRIPSGVSYVLENRRTMTRVFPELFTSQRILPVEEYPARLLGALQAASPPHSRGDPTVVVLTPGVHNSAYFEHSFLARRMGVELVEGRDLVCRENVLYMQTTGGDERVDVVYRRVDDDWLDPVQFEPASLLGCPGLLNAVRAGNVTVANAVGNGVADDKLVYTYVPALIDYYLGEQPVLPNVPTYRLEDPEQREAALERLDQLVLKPVAGSGGTGIVMGPQASDEELARAESAVREDPRGWIAQEVVTLSTAPTRIGAHLEARHVDLRPFAINDGNDVWVLPGGLTRVALRRGSLVVNSSQGGGSKDTWVLAADQHGNGRALHPDDGADVLAVIGATAPSGHLPPDPGPELRTTQQQQQQHAADGHAQHQGGDGPASQQPAAAPGAESRATC